MVLAMTGRVVIGCQRLTPVTVLARKPDWAVLIRLQFVQMQRQIWSASYRTAQDRGPSTGWYAEFHHLPFSVLGPQLGSRGWLFDALVTLPERVDALVDVSLIKLERPLQTADVDPAYSEASREPQK